MRRVGFSVRLFFFFHTTRFTFWKDDSIMRNYENVFTSEYPICFSMSSNKNRHAYFVILIMLTYIRGWYL